MRVPVLSLGHVIGNAPAKWGHARVARRCARGGLHVKELVRESSKPVEEGGTCAVIHGRAVPPRGVVARSVSLFLCG